MSDIVERAQTAADDQYNEFPNYARMLIDELIAEVERLRPRRIETVEELDALPVETLVAHRNRVFVRNDQLSHVWTELDHVWGKSSSLRLAPHVMLLPVMLVWTPEAD